jgi:hypothetical protein
MQNQKIRKAECQLKTNSEKHTHTERERDVPESLMQQHLLQVDLEDLYLVAQTI